MSDPRHFDYPDEVPALPPVTKPTDAVAQARQKYERAYGRAHIANVMGHASGAELDQLWEKADTAWADVLAAVRAECAAKVRAIPRHDWAGGTLIDRNEAIAALEAQP